LTEQVLQRPAGENPSRINRFHQGSWTDPGRFPVNWNRTFELTQDAPQAGFLMLHGLSDSPYSMRALAHSLHERGAWVVGLRLPGHGTAPSGLARVDWRDFTAAVRLAARHLAEKIGPDRPLYLAGYSNGAALALAYTLAALEGESLPLPDGLLLMSPAVAVSPAAAFAKWILYLSRLPGLEKLAWLSIQPEYDPYKYNSFPVNAGYQIYGLTSDIGARINRLDRGEGIKGFPRVLAFQSVVDATIPAAGVVDGLLRRLAPEGHQLVLFDVNRGSATATLLATDPRAQIEALFAEPLAFDLTLVTNRSPDASAVIARHKTAAETSVSDEDLGLAWPAGIYSLSHVAIPFPPDDPLYGRKPPGGPPDIGLGSLELRGELDLLQVPMDQFMRLRHNPFFAYLEKRVFERFMSN
jgi:alpha-beta hydrolase superfamily lysophospholipase